VKQITTMTLEEKVGQLICGRFGWDTAERDLAEGRVGSLYGVLGDMESPAAVAELCNHLQSVAAVPALFVGEQEQGSHRMLPRGTQFPSYMATGATRSPELAYEFGRVCAAEARACGFAWVSCPTVDVNIEPSNPIINTRALGDDPALVSELGTATCRAIVDQRGLTCVCHAPGHGATTCDSHLRMPTVDRSAEDMWEVELAPYRAAIPAGAMNLIMTAHVYYPAWEPEPGLPATLSRNVLTGIMREKLGFTGVIATDGMTMKAIFDNFTVGEAAVKALEAGCDIQLSPEIEEPTRAIIEAIETGRIGMSHLDAAVGRILEAKRFAGLLDSPVVDPAAAEQVVGCEEHHGIAREIARRAATLLRAERLPLPATGRVVVIAAGDDQRLLRSVRRYCPSAEGFDALTQAAEALAAAATADGIIVGVATRVRGYSEESIRGDEALIGLAAQLVATGRHTSLLVLGNPYIVAELPDAAVCMCTYSECDVSIDAAIDALYGGFAPTGRLPVRVSQRYPFGYSA